jgi:hypothetical protein
MKSCYPFCHLFPNQRELKQEAGLALFYLAIVFDYGLDDWAIEVRSPAGARIFSLTSVSRPALGPT